MKENIERKCRTEVSEEVKRSVDPHTSKDPLSNGGTSPENNKNKINDKVCYRGAAISEKKIKLDTKINKIDTKILKLGTKFLEIDTENTKVGKLGLEASIKEKIKEVRKVPKKVENVKESGRNGQGKAIFNLDKMALVNQLDNWNGINCDEMTGERGQAGSEFDSSSFNTDEDSSENTIENILVNK